MTSRAVGTLASRALWGLLAASPLACSGDAPAGGRTFELDRPNARDALDAEETATFTAELTGFWRRATFFDWVSSISHGQDASTGKPDYTMWWHDVRMVKEGDLVTYRHADTGGAHNAYIPTSKLLGWSAAGYLLTSDVAMKKVVVGYAKALSTACRGMVFDADDPNRSLMTRNIVTQNHAYALEDGRRAAIDYEPWFYAYEDWNAQRVHFPNNPYWGDIWVTNMRSKDDVPHIYVAGLALRWLVADAKDEDVRTAAAAGLECIEGFAKDIVDSGYLIRTKDANGDVWIPEEDLASFVKYESYLPNGECVGKLATAHLGYGDAQGNACGLGDLTEYEKVAIASHYYNYSIIYTFHIAAALGATMAGDEAAARQLLRGLAVRSDRYASPAPDEPGLDDPRWHADRAAYLLLAAAVGLPLTVEEARHVQSEYRRAITAYSTFTRWNLWASDVPDGVYDDRGGYMPDHEGHLIPPEELATALFYCGSPYRAKTGAIPVDCARIAKPTEW